MQASPWVKTNAFVSLKSLLLRHLGKVVVPEGKWEEADLQQSHTHTKEFLRNNGVSNTGTRVETCRDWQRGNIMFATLSCSKPLVALIVMICFKAFWHFGKGAYQFFASKQAQKGKHPATDAQRVTL